MSPETLLPYSEIIFRLFLATLCGGLIGIEREKASWFAGLRTHMLVCIGSTLIMMVSQFGFNDVLRPGIVILDPSRVAAQVVSGMGFLGAGTILFWKNKIRGLTTAASLWTVAGVGLAIGGGLYIAALTTTFLVLIVLAILKPLEALLVKRPANKEIRFSIAHGMSLIKIEEILEKMNARDFLRGLQIQSEDTHDTIYLAFSPTGDFDIVKITNELQKLSGVEKIETIE